MPTHRDPIIWAAQIAALILFIAVLILAKAYDI